MGEAWFMGDGRHMYLELMGDLGSLTTSHLKDILTEIASVTGSFGAYVEWHDGPVPLHCVGYNFSV
jgi:hypothetical protein